MSLAALQSLPTPSTTPPPSEKCFPDDESCCDENRQLPRAPPPPLSRAQLCNRFFALIQKYLKELDGRDKSIKIIQYAFKILLHHRLVNAKTWSPMVSQFSMTRKILRLGLAIGPARKLLLEQQPSSPWNTCILLNDIGNTMADDIYCLYKLGLVDAKLGKRAEIVSMYCWFFGILHDLHENYQTLQQLRQANNKAGADQQEKIFMTHISICKLMMDGIFCACDIWTPSFADGVQAWSGFFSGALSGYKLWRKCAASIS